MLVRLHDTYLGNQKKIRGLAPHKDVCRTLPIQPQTLSPIPETQSPQVLKPWTAPDRQAELLAAAGYTVRWLKLVAGLCVDEHEDPTILRVWRIGIGFI